MRVSKNGQNLRFSPDEHLTTAQVKSYFSKLTNNRRRQSQPVTEVTSEEQPEIQQTNYVEQEENHVAQGMDVDSLDQEENSLAQEEDHDDFDLVLYESERQELRLEIGRLLGSRSLWDEEKN